MMYVGIELKEGENGELLIDEVMEDGAAFNDGFLTVSIDITYVYMLHACYIHTVLHLYHV